MQWHVYQRPSIELKMWGHLPTVRDTKDHFARADDAVMNEEMFEKGWHEAKSAASLSPLKFGSPRDDNTLVMWIPLAESPDFGYGFVFTDSEKKLTCIVSPIALLHLGKAEQHASRSNTQYT